MRLRLVCILLGLLVGIPAWSAEILTGEPRTATDLAPELTLSLGFQDFHDQDIDRTYGPMLLPGLDATFKMAPHARLLVGLGYGHRSGDPYYDVSGFSGSDQASLKFLRTRLGLLYDLSRNPSLRVNAGFSLLLDWVREDLPPQFGYPAGSGLDDSPSDGLLTGYLWSFAPEWRLNRDHSLGLEIGYGGSRGRLQADSNSHSIDLTGLIGRAYFVFAL